MDKLTARPLSREEQQDLLGKADRALSAMQVWHDNLKRDNGGKDSPMTQMIASAIVIFKELKLQWALAVGNPQEIRGETLQAIVDGAAEMMKSVLKEQIRLGRF